MPFGVRGLKKAFFRIVLLAALGLPIVSCGGGNKSTSNQHKLSGLRYRAFVSNALFPAGTANIPVINIVDALKDTVSLSNINLIGSANQPTLMAVSPDLSRTMVFSPSGDTVAVVDNTTEAIADVPGTTTPVPTIALPGSTESMFIAKDNISAYAAIPSASVTGQAPGAVVAMNLGTGAISATIPVPNAHYIVGTPDGNHILVFSDDSDNVTVISTALIAANGDPRTVVTGTPQAHFDRPVWAIFTDNTNAYVFNCGPECGGVSAGVTTFAIGNSIPGPTTTVSGASYALLDGTNLYVAGTPPHTACGAGTTAPTCGILTTLDATSLAVTKSGVIITDGYHNRMAMGSNGQLFIGGHDCSNVNITGGEVRGCLSIFNTTTSKVVVPPQIGDATGLQAIAGRNLVYVCQGGAFTIYSTLNDLVYIPPYNSNYLNGTPNVITGQSFDVVIVDPPTS